LQNCRILLIPLPYFFFFFLQTRNSAILPASLLPMDILTQLFPSLNSEAAAASATAAPLVYKIVAIFSILVASAIGVLIPILCRNIPSLHPDSKLFFLIKAFAGGVILATGFVHVLPDAFDSLSNPCSPWSTFPFPGFLAMISAVFTMIVDTLATTYFKGNKSALLPLPADLEETTPTGIQQHLHSHQSLDSDLLRHRVVSQVLELGIVFHSVIIGVSLGASGNTKTIKPLVVALTFHQFFEGLGLGACVSQASFGSRVVTMMVAFFSLTTPIGIAAGICISTIYSDDGHTSVVVGGLMNSVSAGILIYMALVDLLAHDFSSSRLVGNLQLQLQGYVSLLLGILCMSLLAGWA
ncbi:Zinc transporter 5, partial [Linum grandiflorum]